MKKEYFYCILSLLAVAVGIIFAISAVILKSNPLFGRSALLVISIVLTVAGAASFAVYHKKYNEILALCEHKVPIIAHWTYPPNHSKIIYDFYKEQQFSHISTAILFLVLSLIFCFVFAYSGGSYILFTGYILGFMCLCTFILVLRFINTYYNQVTKHEADVIFGEDMIYYLGELIKFQRSYYFLESITIHEDTENYMLLAYGVYDIDEPPAYSVSIPIPPDHLHTAVHIKDYYMELLKPSNE